MSTWNTPCGGALAHIQTYPPPTAMPLVFLDGVVTSLSTLPFQSTSQAFSERSSGSGRWYCAATAPESFCSPIHRPSGVTATPFGNPGGLLKSLVVFALRTGIGRLRPDCAN